MKNPALIAPSFQESGTVLKRFYKEGDNIRLHPENRDLADIIVSDCQIQGVAVKVIKDLL